MLIICEGVDGGGKSTLVHHIAEHHRAAHPTATIRTLHKGPPTPGTGPFLEYEVGLHDLTNLAIIGSTSDLLLLDRWHVGEAIYGPLLRGESRLTPGGMLHVELAMRSLGAVLVMAQPRNMTIAQQRVRSRGDTVITPEQVPAIHAAYEQHAQRYGYLRMTDISIIVPTLLSMAENVTATTMGEGSLRQRCPGWLGTVRPTVLLVGDQHNPNNTDATNPYIHPFTPRHVYRCSFYLMEALAESRLDPTSLAIVNINDVAMDPTSLVGSLPVDCRVVALGNQASSTLHRVAIPHEKVPHPQWAMRFRRHHRDEYTQQIEEAAGVH